MLYFSVCHVSTAEYRPNEQDMLQDYILLTYQSLSPFRLIAAPSIPRQTSSSAFRSLLVGSSLSPEQPKKTVEKALSPTNIQPTWLTGVSVTYCYFFYSFISQSDIVTYLLNLNPTIYLLIVQVRCLRRIF